MGTTQTFSFCTPVVVEENSNNERFKLGRFAEKIWDVHGKAVRVNIVAVSPSSNRLHVRSLEKQQQSFFKTILKIIALVVFFPFIFATRIIYRSLNKFFIETIEIKRDHEEDILAEFPSKNSTHQIATPNNLHQNTAGSKDNKDSKSEALQTSSQTEPKKNGETEEQKKNQGSTPTAQTHDSSSPQSTSTTPGSPIPIDPLTEETQKDPSHSETSKNQQDPTQTQNKDPVANEQSKSTTIDSQLPVQEQEGIGSQSLTPDPIQNSAETAAAEGASQQKPTDQNLGIVENQSDIANSTIEGGASDPSGHVISQEEQQIIDTAKAVDAAATATIVVPKALKDKETDELFADGSQLYNDYKTENLSDEEKLKYLSNAVKHFAYFIYKTKGLNEKQKERMTAIENGLLCLKEILTAKHQDVIDTTRNKFKKAPDAVGKMKSFYHLFTYFSEHREVPESENSLLEAKYAKKFGNITPSTSKYLVDKSKTNLSLDSDIIYEHVKSSGEFLNQWACSRTAGRPKVEINATKMEDRYLASQFKIEETVFELFAVFDGHNDKSGKNGYSCADWASKNIQIFIEQELRNNKCNFTVVGVTNLLIQAVVKLNDQWKKVGKDNSGTTLTGALIFNNTIAIFNVGDSRAVLIRENGIVQLTTDAQYRDESKDKEGCSNKKYQTSLHLKGGTLEPMKKGDPYGKLSGILEPFRSIGSQEFVGEGLSARPEILVFSRDGLQNDRLVLATDGLWDVVDTEELSEFKPFLSDENSKSMFSVDHISSTLIDKASMRWQSLIDEGKIDSGDNNTILTIDLKPIEKK